MNIYKYGANLNLMEMSISIMASVEMTSEAQSDNASVVCCSVAAIALASSRAANTSTDAMNALSVSSMNN